MRRKIQVACHILGLIVVIFSIGWGFWVELYYKKLPCILCFLQRASMFGMGIGLYWNLSLGIRLKQYALAVLWALFGLFCSLRHIAVNACQESGNGVLTLFSYHLYTWAFFVFFLSLVGMTLLLLLYKKEENKPSKTMKWGWGIFLLVFLLLALFSAWRKQGWCF